MAQLLPMRPEPMIPMCASVAAMVRVGQADLKQWSCTLARETGGGREERDKRREFLGLRYRLWWAPARSTQTHHNTCLH